MTAVGYARVSSTGQSLDVQQEQLAAAGCEKVFAEKKSGRTAKDRPQLADAISFVREGDVFVVTRLDRLARSIGDLNGIVKQLQAKRVGFRVLQQGGIDTTTPNGRLMLNVLGAFAEFEADIRAERQRDGIDKAKRADKKLPPEERTYKGRPPNLDVWQQVRDLAAKDIGASEIAKRLKIGRASVYRILEQAPQDGP